MKKSERLAVIDGVTGSREATREFLEKVPGSKFGRVRWSRAETWERYGGWVGYDILASVDLIPSKHGVYVYGDEVDVYPALKKISPRHSISCEGDDRAEVVLGRVVIIGAVTHEPKVNFPHWGLKSSMGPKYYPVPNPFMRGCERSAVLPGSIIMNRESVPACLSETIGQLPHNVLDPEYEQVQAGMLCFAGDALTFAISSARNSENPIIQAAGESLRHANYRLSQQMNRAA